MKCWTRIDLPELPLFAEMGYSVAQTDWYAIDDQHTPPSLIKAVFTKIVNMKNSWTAAVRPIVVRLLPQSSCLAKVAP